MRKIVILAAIVLLLLFLGCAMDRNASYNYETASVPSKLRFPRAAAVRPDTDPAPAAAPTQESGEHEGHGMRIPDSGGETPASSAKLTRSRPVTVAAPVYTAEQGMDDVVNQLQLANMAFTMPEKANIEEKIRAELVIDFNKAGEELAAELRNSGQVSTSSVLVTKIITARLGAAADAFAVRTVGDTQRQALSTVAPTRWIWELTPLKAGSHSVDLTITAEVTVDGVKESRQIDTFHQQVAIEVTSTQQFMSWLKANWQWSWGVVVPPLLGWLWARRKTKPSRRRAKP